MSLYEYFKHPLPALLNLFNLRRVTPYPMLPIPKYDPYIGAKPKAKDPFMRPSQAIAESIKRKQYLNRIQKCAIFEEMIRDPLNVEIVSAFAEAATTLNTDKGAVFWVTAQNEDIQKILTDLYAYLGCQEKAFAQVSAMFLHGDNFLGLRYTDKSNGLIAMQFYDPWKVSRIVDELNRLTGYAPADGTGEPDDMENSAVPPYDILHQHLLSRNQQSGYGSSLFDPDWERWEDMQSMLDQIVLQRLLRRPDRLMILMDTTGMSMQEAFEQIKIWETYLYKEINVNTGQHMLSSRGIPMTENRDLIIPKGPNSNTEITNMPATTGNDLFRDWDIVVSLYLGGFGMPKGYFGFEGGDYQAGLSLARQDPRFARRAGRGQFAFLTSMTRLGMIHLTLQGIDVFRNENQFELHGMPVSYFMEIEFNELLQMRFDLVDRMARTGQDLQLPREEWLKYVLVNVGKMPKTMIDSLLAPPKTAAQAQDQAAMAEDVKPLIEVAAAVEEALANCRSTSGVQMGFGSEQRKQIAEGTKKSWSSTVFESAASSSVVTSEQEARAKNRLNRLRAMASSIG